VLKRKSVATLLLVLLLVLVLLLSGCSGTNKPAGDKEGAQGTAAKVDWPTKPVKFVVHTGPGPLDTFKIGRAHV